MLQRSRKDAAHHRRDQPLTHYQDLRVSSRLPTQDRVALGDDARKLAWMATMRNVILAPLPVVVISGAGIPWVNHNAVGLWPPWLGLESDSCFV